MKSIKSIIIFLVVAGILIFGITYLTRSSVENSYTNTIPVSKATNASYTLAQVQTHSDSSSCWTIIGGNVYDLTAWINSHPGGPEAILSICGKDGTAAFEDQHGGQRRPANELAGFLIGAYKK